MPGTIGVQLIGSGRGRRRIVLVLGGRTVDVRRAFAGARLRAGRWSRVRMIAATTVGRRKRMRRVYRMYRTRTGTNRTGTTRATTWDTTCSATRIDPDWIHTNRRRHEPTAATRAETTSATESARMRYTTESTGMRCTTPSQSGFTGGKWSCHQCQCACRKEQGRQYACF